MSEYKVIENIEKLCQRDNISISKLEKELGFGNGSIKKTGDHGAKMSGIRLYQIARYFEVNVEYIMTGQDVSQNKEKYDISYENKLLSEMNKEYTILNESYKRLTNLQVELADYRMKKLNQTLN